MPESDSPPPPPDHPAAGTRGGERVPPAPEATPPPGPHPGRETKEILFLIPYKPTRPYFSSLYCECERKIYEDPSGQDYRLIWRFLPKEGAGYEEQVAYILGREFRQSDRIRLLVVAPRRSEALTETIAQCSSRLGIRVVSVALPFQFEAPFGGAGRRPPAVYTDGAKCMQKLAEAAFEELRTKWGDHQSFDLVLVPGEEERTDSKERIDGFERELRACCVAAGAELKPASRLGACDWQRDRARAAFEDHLQTTKGDRHVVFAANDEMALGVRDAILAANSPRVSECIVYGFDEIPEVRTLIKSGDRHMKGTVGQDVPQMAKKLAGLIYRVLDPTAEGPITDFTVDPLPPCLPDPPEGFARYVQTHLKPYKATMWVDPGDASDITGVPVDTLKKRRERAKPEETYTEGNVKYARDNHRVVSRQHGAKVKFLAESLKREAD